MKFNHQIVSVPFGELPELCKQFCQVSSVHLTVSVEIASLWLQTEQHVSNTGKNNPRKTGRWKFITESNFNLKWVATEYLKRSSCENCPVRIKLIKKLLNYETQYYPK